MGNCLSRNSTSSIPTATLPSTPRNKKSQYLDIDGVDKGDGESVPSPAGIPGRTLKTPLTSNTSQDIAIDGAEQLKHRISCDEYWQGTSDLIWEMWPVLGASALLLYDQMLYTYAINEITATVFSGSTELAWICYGISIAVQPIGSVIIGGISDFHGRKAAMQWSSAITLAGVIGMGLVPGQAGALGIGLMMSTSIMQGIGIGGLMCFGVYTVERMPLWCVSKGFVFLDVAWVFGISMAGTLYSIFEVMLTHKQMLAWGWRAPFILAIIPTLIAMWGADQLEEIDVNVENHTTVDEDVGIFGSFVSLFAKYPLHILLGIGVQLGSLAAQFISTGYLVQWFPTYAGVSEPFSVVLITILNYGHMLVYPVVGYLTDIYGASKVLLIGTGACTLLTLPSFLLVLYTDVPYFFATVLEAMLITSVTLMVPAMVLSLGMAPPEVRAMASGFTTIVATVLATGVSLPLISWWSMKDTPAPGYIMVIIFAVTMASTFGAVMANDRGIQMSYLRDEPF